MAAKEYAVWLTEVEANHLWTLIHDSIREGSYYGNKEQYRKRGERIRAKLLAATTTYAK
jgi:hypothetical protein